MHDHNQNQRDAENELFLQLDREARAAAFALEMAGRLTPGFTEQHYPLTRREQIELRRLNAALTAAPDAAVFCALARGEAVPASRLNPRLVHAHYRRLAHVG